MDTPKPTDRPDALRRTLTLSALGVAGTGGALGLVGCGGDDNHDNDDNDNDNDNDNDRKTMVVAIRWPSCASSTAPTSTRSTSASTARRCSPGSRRAAR